MAIDKTTFRPARLALVLAAALTVQPGAAWATPPTEPPAVQVTVSGIAAGRGSVRVALCDRATFLGKCPVAQVLRAEADRLVVLLRPPGPGRFAVSAFQDVDGDGVLRRGAFGAPTEPYGFSRDARGMLGPPDFDDAAFDIGPGAAPPAIGIALR